MALARRGVPGVGRRTGWCDVFEISDWQIQRCFIYLDPDYAGKDTARATPGWRRPDRTSSRAEDRGLSP